MAKFRKKPVVVEAMQWTGKLECIDVMNKFITVKDWGMDGEHLTIPTLEGMHYASPGDWIIKGVKGEFYPCKPDIFEATYDVVKSVTDVAGLFPQIEDTSEISNCEKAWKLDPFTLLVKILEPFGDEKDYEIRFIDSNVGRYIAVSKDADLAVILKTIDIQVPLKG